MKTLVIDFDGVIHEYSEGWEDGSIYDPPVEGARENLKKLATQYELVIHTTRENKQEIKRWLKIYGFDMPLKIVTGKPRGIAYIDDRAVRFTNWRDIRNLFYSSQE